jgi:hypothetical protein
MRASEVSALPGEPRADAWRRRARSPFAGRPGRPLLVGGCPRSGTTLLRTLLDNHPVLAVPPETDFVIPLWVRRGRFRDLRDPRARRRVAEWIFDTPWRGGNRLRAGAIGRDEAVARVVAAPPTLGSLFAAAFAVFADVHGKPRWGDKRPGYAVYVDAVFALFPDAQLINLVRDPRAAAASQVRAPWYRDGRRLSVQAAAANWAVAIDRVDRYAERLRPDQLLDVRYEDLVLDPRGTLSRVCAFAGLDHGPELDEMIAGPRDEAFRPGWHDRVAEPISAAPLERWRTDLTERQVALVEHAAGPHLARFGYAAEAGPPEPADVRALAYQHRLRARKWRRYALGERKRRLLHHRPVAAVAG